MNNNLLSDSLDKLSIGYDDDKLSKLEKFYELLTEKNKVMNLTTITEYEEFVIKHIVDSLVVIKFISLEEGMLVADLGTGAGFPGVPLAVFFPNVKFVLMDSVNKKLNFVNEAAGELDLSNIETIHGRAEDIAHLKGHREKYDFVLSRAVSKLPSLAELSLGLVKKDGYFIAYKSDNTDEEIKEAIKAIKVMGGKYEKYEDILLPNSDINRRLYFIRKPMPTPKQYPRKAGEPSRKPVV